MEYVNAIIEACQSASVINREFKSYTNPFDTISLTKDSNGKWICPEFDAVLRITILGTANPENNPNNPILQKKFLAFQLNMTQYHKDKKLRLTKVLDRFSIDLSKVKLDTDCFDYYSMTRVVRVTPPPLPSDSNKYALKLFVIGLDKRPEQGLESLDWANKSSIQTLYQIRFIEE